MNTNQIQNGSAAGVRSTAELGEWIDVSEKLPQNLQDVIFVIDCPHDHNHRRVIGGRYVEGYGFGVPGATWNASHWMPSPKPPTFP